LRLNRKYILLIALALVLANLVFFYVKTRPKPPDVVLEISLWRHFSQTDRTEEWVHLDRKNQWRTQDGKLANLARLASLTIPNMDSPDYSILVEQQTRWTLGDVVKAVRASAAKGICNLTILDRELRSVDNPKSDHAVVPVLTVVKYSKHQGGPLTPCVTDPVILQRYETAEQEYNRGRRDFTE
jgi:hypothetical protein